MNGIMFRKILLFFAIFTLEFAIFASEVELSVSPQPLVKGQQGRLELTSSSGEPDLLETPEIEGIKWLGKSGVFSQMEIINFKQSKRTTVSYSFLVEKDGQINFPALKVKIGKKKVATDPFTIDAISPKFTLPGETSQDSENDLDKYLFLRAVPLSDRTEFYVGEEIPFEIIAYTASGIRCELSWPEINAQNLIFRDFSHVNRENARFAGYQNASENLNGKTYNTYRFRTVFKSLTAGTISGSAVVNAEIRIPRNRSSQRRDPFFGDFFFDPFSRDERYQHTLSCKLPEISILPLPEKIEDIPFIGLVGDWKISFDIQDSKFRRGENFTLKINIEGKGGLDNLRAPELKIDGFRVFPPETTRRSKVTDIKESAVLEYLLVPVNEGEANIEISLLTFSSPEKKYLKWNFSKRINVEKGDDNINSTVVSSGKILQSQIKRVSEDNTEKSADILYPKKKNYGSLVFPIWKNNVGISIGIVFVALIIFIVCEIIVALLNRNLTPELIRKKSALKNKNTILRKIKKLKEDDIDKFIRDELCPWLNDLNSFSPGTSPEELVKLLNHEELKEIIEDAASSVFAPGRSGISADDKKRKLLNALKKMLCVSAIFISSFSLFGNENVAPLKTSIKNNPYELYDSGDFAAAADAFSAESPNPTSDPYILYNIGCCFYRLGKVVDALYCFEKAHLLLPRDSDILENLNHTRRKLELREKGVVESPLDLVLRLRDYLRPDEWLLMASIFFAAIFIALIFRRKIAIEYLGLIIISLIFITAIAIFAVSSHLSNDYSKDHALIVNKASNLFVLPSENSEKIKIKLKEGQSLKIVEKRSDWTRVRLNSNEGWIKNENIKALWE